MSEPEIDRRIRAWGDLPEHAMRRARLAQWLRVVSAPTAIRVLERLIVAARGRDSKGTRLYLAVIDLLETDPQIRARIPTWREAAREEGLIEVAWFLEDPQPLRVPADDDETPLHPELEELTLGERKARARRAQPRDFDKFAAERDPQVLAILYRHPSMVERQVVRWLARRPLYAEHVHTLFTCPKWLASAAVRRAVILNPYTPPRLALRLLPLLAWEELTEIVRAEDLHEAVRLYAERLRRLGDYADPSALVPVDSTDAEEGVGPGAAEPSGID